MFISNKKLKAMTKLLLQSAEAIQQQELRLRHIEKFLENNSKIKGFERRGSANDE